MSVMERSRVRFISLKEAENERAKIIEETGNDEKALRRRAESWSLDEHETYLFSQLEALDYLINGR